MYAQTPAFRNSDPRSSAEADEHMNASGKKAFQQRAVVAAVDRYHGLTSLELAKRTGLCRFVLARRLPEAEREGLVRRGPERACSVSKRRACVWFPPEAAVQSPLFPEARRA